ncbi:uncharacterized protein N7498_007596 [Penicillium cinerascens]|uniref:Uncharacterized protein n=1 Tax=Penicillium cinerascens TaxID=70096 RepID=A0A9W9JK90_9EURO|nr:uncharacterized protein N7498_007596 [Penicillium cinerascens]KAJ5198479.1 hypothetical protein N7498_007596 [Penicillium cinerascens]
MPPKPSMSSQSVVYESDTRSEERTSQPTRTEIQAIFQIARPAPKSSLGLAPKLLLQIQQLVQNKRPVPVLEMWQPPFQKSKLTRNFHQKVKLRSGDIYATLDESYITTSTGRQKDFSNAEQDSDGATPEKRIIAAICQNDNTTSTIYFRDARCRWQTSVSTGLAQSTPTYRFTINDENRDISDPGRIILQWEKRSKENALGGSLDAEQFVLLLIDRKARRKCRIATMTPGGFKIVVCFDLTEPMASTVVQDRHEALEIWLYTQTLTLGSWVAYQEGWLNYN